MSWAQLYVIQNNNDGAHWLEIGKGRIEKKKTLQILKYLEVVSKWVTKKGISVPKYHVDFSFPDNTTAASLATSSFSDLDIQS